MKKIEFTKDELRLLNNALNEILHGVDIPDTEFQTRTGSTREQAKELLHKIAEYLDVKG